MAYEIISTPTAPGCQGLFTGRLRHYDAFLLFVLLLIGDVTVSVGSTLYVTLAHIISHATAAEAAVDFHPIAATYR